MPMEIMGTFIHLSIFWIVIAVAFGIIEAFSMGLATIWFTVGAVAAAVVSWLDGSILLQVIVFVVVSVVLLYFTRPILEKKLKVGKTRTNVDALVGQKALVTADIQPYLTGIAVVGAQSWTAIGEDPAMLIPEGTTVTILRIEGVKLVVSPGE